MSAFEYKVIPAPSKGEKARGVKGADGRFAHAIETVMNDMAADGWEYQRAETLPSEERSGLTNSVTVWRNVLVFRRPRADDLNAFQPRLLDPPAKAQALPNPTDDEDENGTALDGLNPALRRRAASQLNRDAAE